MRTDTPQAIYRKDYTPPSYWVDTVEMGFDLDPELTRIATRLTMTRNPDSHGKSLTLYGEAVDLVHLRMNGKELTKRAYSLVNGVLEIPNAPDNVTLEIETAINPSQNTSLMGLYVSNGNFFTQCEAEGFRKVTYFPDRPDVMAKYTVMLRADKEKYPVLLSNGNLIEQGDLGDGRHYALWEDPFKKPSYLFALVAGDLVCQEETYTLQSGREVLLQVWVEEGNLDKTQHAMESLKNSIRWDEERFGLELDLDRFMIVAVGDFNMGAMENKGLNIFNTKYVLANPRIATDVDYANIESVVGHEYFHNWTGNRVTCRDWFQLSLKEGLTVFRDQEFSADMIGTESGRAVSRIDQVRTLRQAQFPEDAGPMAHPVRPDSFVEINNFYTVTVYEIGAEVVRMYQTLLGREGFRKGMDLYFERHDGQAVTVDDFRRAMADANDRDLTLFDRWYSLAGT
ncbi:MAG: pepN, partial [Burkholderia sp.]|nr:pepN [Burkholderia sp.]